MILTQWQSLNHASKCKLQIKLRQPTEIVGEKLKVKVSKSKILSGGFFKKDSIIVTLKVSPKGWKVARTYDDFKWLQSCLRSRFPGNYIVELPRVKITEQSKDLDEYHLGEYIN